MRQILRALSVVLILLAIALVSALITMRLAIHGAEVRVPALSGLTLPQAAAALHAHGLEMGIDGRYYSTTQPAGHVLTQSSAPGTKVRKSWNVRVTVSMGPQKVAIPSLEGMNERMATITIRRIGLQLGSVIPIPYAYAPENTVIAQTPLANATGVQQPSVALLTAQPPPPPEPAASVMPDLTGESFTAAALAILHAGFKLAPLSNPIVAPAGPSPEPPQTTPPAVAQHALPGVVIAQNPAAGSRIPAGATIQLTIQP